MSTKEVKEFSIVKTIMAILKLDDAGKISKFINQEVRTAKEAIEGLKLNRQGSELVYKQGKTKLERQIEDAKEEVEDAYTNIKPENVDTNAKMTAFASQYWAGIAQAESKLVRLEKELESLVKSHEETTKDNEEQIAKYQARIDKISK